MGYGYSIQLDEKAAEKVARASGRAIPVKPKFAVEVCRAIKGRTVPKAKAFLERVVKLEEAVPFKKTVRHVKHRKGKMGPGQYPVKVAAAVLRVLENAEANAEYKGLEPEDMVIFHACAHRGTPIPGMMPRAHGRATAWNTSTSHIEIMIRERGEGSEPAPAKDADAEVKKKAPAKKAAKPKVEKPAEAASAQVKEEA